MASITMKFRRTRRLFVFVCMFFLTVLLKLYTVTILPPISSEQHIEEDLSEDGITAFFHKDLKHTNAFLIQPKLNCNQQYPTNIVVTVISKAANFIERETIRRTWGSVDMQNRYNFSLYFILGTEENVNNDMEGFLNGDIVQADIKESFYHLTEKTIAAFKWVTLFCHKAKFFFKTDDDVFFDLEFLKEIQNNEISLNDDVVIGDCVFNGLPEREGRPKYELSSFDYPFRNFPPYCGGPGYMLTVITAQKLYNKMLVTRSIKFEDVYVGIVAYRLGLSLKHVKYFVHYMEEEKEKQLFYVTCSRVTHRLEPDHIQRLWDNLGTVRRNREDCI
ncbi:beta-1,3-galactosyltransferase 5-like isoform X1 [Argopecten irradians]|uniref:beta-1,3-galactosyltransferase 5-like isoform X1 n=1 Tax=Argopecten irradians TaxID=31199 RepID=UPI003710D0BD